MKTCSKCGTDYPADLEHFGPHTKTRSGLQPTCRPCERARNREFKRALRASLVASGRDRTRIASVELCGAWPPTPSHDGRRGTLLESVRGADGQTYYVVRLDAQNLCYALLVRYHGRLLGMQLEEAG